MWGTMRELRVARSQSDVPPRRLRRPSTQKDKACMQVVNLNPLSRTLAAMGGGGGERGSLHVNPGGQCAATTRAFQRQHASGLAGLCIVDRRSHVAQRHGDTKTYSAKPSSQRAAPPAVRMSEQGGRETTACCVHPVSGARARHFMFCPNPNMAPIGVLPLAWSATNACCRHWKFWSAARRAAGGQRLPEAPAACKRSACSMHAARAALSAGLPASASALLTK
jgi:hypothetical protein